MFFCVWLLWCCVCCGVVCVDDVFCDVMIDVCYGVLMCGCGVCVIVWVWICIVCVCVIDVCDCGCVCVF